MSYKQAQWSSLAIIFFNSNWPQVKLNIDRGSKLIHTQLSTSWTQVYLDTSTSLDIGPLPPPVKSTVRAKENLTPRTSHFWLHPCLDPFATKQRMLSSQHVVLRMRNMLRRGNAERKGLMSGGVTMSMSRRKMEDERKALIDPSRNRYPYCVVWTPLPIITWVSKFTL